MTRRIVVKPGVPGTAVAPRLAGIPRIAWIELRRTGVVVIGVVIAALAWGLAGDPERWDGLWMGLVLAHYGNVAVLWPVVLAACAWQGRRDRAARITDLVASTPRSGLRRTAPLAVLLALLLAGGYAAGLLEGLGHAVLTASYRPPGWYWPVLVGALAVAAAGMLGLGLGRLMPSRLTAPLLLLVGYVLVVGPLVLGESTGARALLLTPGYLGSDDQWSTVDWRTLVGQAAWFAALAVTGWMLLAAGTRRSRILAMVPALVGIAVALPLFPPLDRAAPHDPGAVALVCADGTPRVCVTRLYEPALPQLVGPARRALEVLARLPGAPTAVVQGTGTFGYFLEQRRDTVAIYLSMGKDGTLVTASGDSIEEGILDGAGTWTCGGTNGDTAGWNSIQAARTAASLWLRGVATAPETVWAPVRELVERALAILRALPVDAQVARVAALRDAALACRADLYDVLTR